MIKTSSPLDWLALMLNPENAATGRLALFEGLATRRMEIAEAQ